MTKQEYKEIRADYKYHVKALWEEYKRLSGDGFNPENPQADAAYYRYMRLLTRFAALLNCSPARAADVLNIR